MVSKSQSKLIRSLNQKKFRLKHGLFVVEGVKSINEFLNSSLELYSLFSTEDIFLSHTKETQLISLKELQAISHLSTAQVALAVFKIPTPKTNFKQNRLIALDGVRDPGNLGTIIRLCDWFNIQSLICSKDTVDCYNPKVVQATMGSLTRVEVIYTDLHKHLSTLDLPIFGTFMNGESVYSKPLPEDFVIVMGNEANGVTKEIEELCNYRISIPQFGSGAPTESLNVATATAITLSEFSRRLIER
ncbi:MULTISPECIES: TrmH family RNA methyltransferase [Croceibacter]|uniref:TrmH family RNA methyltransferase n=1 Tax=Croceibacter TaxID=216431 RepID=UPI000C4A5904|nr:MULTISPECIES: RNA methyltransferase [Croceibacter]MBG25022.1 RNA methyltransferase [Croceibacter sp.]|tara:strand:+ start:1323 stop:2057 length:735 start_codon:yes stop_codon:yes gene_type:complete